MQTSSYDDKGNLSLVEPHQVQGSVEAADPETLGPRVLELSSVLQTTLDVEQQLALFFKAIQGYLQIDGIHYANADEGLDHKSGTTATHRATYNLTVEKRDLGILRFFREMPFTGKEVKLLENLLCGLVYPMRNALSYLAAVRLASHDPLTGVQNRLAMDRSLEREVDLAHRQKSPLTILVIDADYFKRFNDEHGHTFGDDVLKALANSAAATVRRSDLLFRYGGEEFVVIASHTAQQGGSLLAERIRRAVENIDTIRGRDVDITVSIGIAEMSIDDTAESLFERADEAMYQAKQGGRNRVVAI